MRKKEKESKKREQVEERERKGPSVTQSERQKSRRALGLQLNGRKGVSAH